ncbi:hypothetical protein IWQ56_001378, partial [Coemansia nantahalensis]
MEPTKGSPSPVDRSSAAAGGYTKRPAVAKPSQSDAAGIRLTGTVPYHELYIGGVQVHFPFQPYPSQLGMMNHMIRALNRKQNVMIESPTGSGKSLALLCASLAWSRNFTSKQRQLRANMEAVIRKYCRHNQAAIARLHDASRLKDDRPASPNKDSDLEIVIDGLAASIELEEHVLSDDEDDADADPATPVAVPSGTPSSQPERTVASPTPSTPASYCTACTSPACGGTTATTSNAAQQKGAQPAAVSLESLVLMAVTIWKPTVDHILRAANAGVPAGLTSADIEVLKEARENLDVPKPRIYFGSRTHRQVAQLVDELRRKTPYRLRTAMLGSRSQTCLLNEASEVDAVDEMCRDLLDSSGCSFFSRTQKLAGSHHLQAGGELEIWDLEDIVELGRKVGGCPYYAARSLAESAELTFCPYNYIVDPSIRSAVGVNLHNSIVILDEAHNIEGVAREAGSLEITDLQLVRMAKECAKIIELMIMVRQHTLVMSVAQTLADWLRSSDMVYEFSDHEKQTAVWPNDGASLGELLDSLSLTPALIAALDRAYVEIDADIKSRRAEKNRTVLDLEPDVQLSLGAMRNVQRLLWVLKCAMPGSKYSGDYRAAASRAAVRALPDARPSGRRRRPSSRSSEQAMVVNTLALWSMNPGVVFSEIAEEARSVVLTSGTLSPVGSYASELQAEFASTLEANHVIDPQRFMAMVVECGPSGQPVVAKHSTVSLMSFQDDVGAAVVAIAAQSPDGMLVFAPSYALLSSLFARWETTGHMDALKQSKEVFLEPPGGSSDAFAKMMTRFQETLARKQGEQGPATRGAVLFAVYRGKVSEGIDFADQLCRTVVNIGIPYPAFKDVQVILKREYNDSRSRPAAADDGTGHAERLVSGGEWYETQAF